MTPVDHALDQFATSLDHLVKLVDDGGLDHYDHAGLVAVMQGFERVRNRLPLVDHRLISQGEATNLSDALAQGSMPRVLVSALGVSPSEAGRRVRAAAAVGERTSMLGQALAPVRPHLSAAQRAGEVNPEQVAIIERALDRVDRRGFNPGDIDAGEQILTEFAAQHGTKDLKGLTDRVVDAIDPDGTLPNDQLNTERRFFHLRPTRDGAYTGEFRLTGSLGAKLAALLQPLARPRLATAGSTADTSGGDSGGTGGGPAVRDVDPRHHDQRLHDALEDLCDRLLRAGDLPDSGGTPTSVIVTIDLDDLLNRAGYGTTGDGTLLPADQVRRLVNSADAFPTFVNAKGVVLDMGRTRRIATHTQTLALIARDLGCSFPGCAHPAEYCERHHILDWINGGKTNLDNLTLLCRYHHHNFLARGWTCTINADGLPEWRPPRWLDRNQTPMINSRILARLKATRHARELKRRPPEDAASQAPPDDPKQ